VRSSLFITIYMISFGIFSNYGNIQSDSLIHSLRYATDDRAKVRTLLNISKSEEVSDPESSLKYANQALLLALKVNYDSAEVRAMIQMGINLNRLNRLKEGIEMGEKIVQRATEENMQLEIADGRNCMAVAFALAGDFDHSSKLNFENLRLYEKLGKKRLAGATLGLIGADFISLGSYTKALDYVNKSLQIAIEIDDKPAITDQYNNLAAIYQAGFQDYPIALDYYLKALSIAKEIDDFQVQGINMINIGRVYLELKNVDSAYIFFNRSIELFRKVNNPLLMADSYTALGDYYFRLEDFPKAKLFSMKALEIGNESQVSQTVYYASDLLYRICLKEQDSSSALIYLSERTIASDSIYALQNQRDLFRLELQYTHDKISKEQKIRQQRNYFILGIVIIILISGLIIIFLFYSKQKIKTKNSILEREKIESNLKFKSKELSINLLALLKKNELITDVSRKLSGLEKTLNHPEVRDEVARLNREIKMNTDNKLWQEFSLQFKESNKEFYDKLLESYPDLSQSELKLCAYLRLNMSTKEISELTGQRAESIDVARYRLRKKLGITKSDSNLVTFLAQI